MPWYDVLWRILRPVMLGLTVLIVVAGILVSGYHRIYDAWFAPVDKDDSSEIVFRVTSGQSLSSVANRLEEAELINNRTVFKYYCDFAGMGQKIQTGSYLLNRSMTMLEIAERLTNGDGNPIVRNITLIPGETLEDFAAKLLANGVLTETGTFLELCRTGKAFREYYYVADVLASSRAEERKYVLEGYLSPNTYEVYTDASAESIIRKLLSQTEAVFTETYQDRMADLGMTMDQILTMASLIEKESKNEDFAKVGAVFHNRLKAGMKLQSDVTVHYITGVRKMVLNGEDLNIASPYNTYLNKGLPLGPVCNPSPAAVTAALYPDETYLAENYLYFCAKDPESGELHFSRTLSEHEQAVSIYAPLWEAYDRSRGIQ